MWKYLSCSILLCSAATAQVFTNCCSYTLTPGGYALIANQFQDGNTLASVFPSVPGGTSLANAGTELYMWNCSSAAFDTYYYKTNASSGGPGWRSSTSNVINAGTNAFLPGVGAILFNNTSTNYTYIICGG